ncbi:MAG: DUF433 domain-containing protein [Pseudonocardiaceae bacterium]
MYDSLPRGLPGALGEDDARFSAPLLTVPEVGRNLLISSSTVKDWKTSELVHAVTPVRRGAPSVPLAGVAEAQVLRGLRLSGLPPTEIARVTRSLREELGEYALIKERLAHDGRSIFRDVARRTDAPQWVRVRDGQLLLPRIVDDHLTYLEWAPDGFPVRLRLRSYRQANADVILDPGFGYGKPVFERTKVRTKDVMRQFLAGEKPEDIASDYDLTEDEVLAAIRVLSGYRDAAGQRSWSIEPMGAGSLMHFGMLACRS